MNKAYTHAAIYLGAARTRRRIKGTKSPFVNVVSPQDLLDRTGSYVSGTQALRLFLQLAETAFASFPIPFLPPGIADLGFNIIMSTARFGFSDPFASDVENAEALEEHVEKYPFSAPRLMVEVAGRMDGVEGGLAEGAMTLRSLAKRTDRSMPAEKILAMWSMAHVALEGSVNPQRMYEIGVEVFRAVNPDADRKLKAELRTLPTSRRCS